MYQFWVIQLLLLFLANFGIFAFVYIKSKKCYQSSAEGLLGYSAAIFAITSHNIYSNTLHSWIPRNIMGGIRKKISWHPELSQLLYYYLYPYSILTGDTRIECVIYRVLNTKYEITYLSRANNHLGFI